ncbi:MAG: DNA polymerase III subunit beta [bacterium]|nr:DNA polymerase III subunit beta [bacterium]
MKLRVNRQELAEAMGIVASVAVTRSTPKPILQCVLIRAKGDHLELEATDQEIGLRHIVTQVEVEQTGEVLVPADKFGPVVREATDEILVLESEGATYHVRGADCHFQICSQETGDFPAVGTGTGQPDFEIDAEVLQRLCERTVFAAARENSRYAINGVLWEQEREALRLVATDGRRLAHATGALTAAAEGESSAIVPVKTMHVYQRILGEGAEKIGIQIAGNQIILYTPRVTVSSALVEGHFPKYQDVIPADCNKRAELGVTELLGAVRQAALLTNDESRGVRFSLSEGQLSLTSRAPQEGEAEITKAIRYSGEPIEIGFNPNFVTDVLRVVHEDEVAIEFKEPNRPGLLRSGDDFLYVIMPVNLS